MKHLNFMEEWSPTGKTKVITILSNHDETNLGKIVWSGRWRQYVFEPTMEEETIWSWECLEDLKGFVIQLNKEQKTIVSDRKSLLNKKKVSIPPNLKGIGYPKNTIYMTEQIQPVGNPYKELRKELILVYHQLGKTLNKIDLILKELEGK